MAQAGVIDRRDGVAPAREISVARIRVVTIIAILAAWGQSGVPEDITGDWFKANMHLFEPGRDGV